MISINYASLYFIRANFLYFIIGSLIAGFYSAYLLNYDGIKLVFHSDADFAVSPFEYISGTTARAAQLYVKAQLIADFLGGQGLLYNAEA